MNVLNTEFSGKSIMIDDVEYAIAENTIETSEKLNSALKSVEGQPRYKAWLAEIEVLLGKAAYKELFKAGKKENIDRIHAIHHAVVMEFMRTGMDIESEQNDEQIDKVMSAIKPMNDLLTNVNKITGNDEKKVVRRV